MGWNFNGNNAMWVLLLILLFGFGSRCGNGCGNGCGNSCCNNCG